MEQLSLGGELRPPPAPAPGACPRVAEHEPGPEDVNEWIAWAEARLARGDTQHRCSCGHAFVWTAA